MLNHPVDHGAIPANIMTSFFALVPLVVEDLFLDRFPFANKLAIANPRVGLLAVAMTGSCHQRIPISMVIYREK